MTPVESPRVTLSLGSRHVTLEAAELATLVSRAIHESLAAMLFASPAPSGERKGALGDGEGLPGTPNETNGVCSHSFSFREEGGPGEEGTLPVDSPERLADELARVLDDARSLAFFQRVSIEVDRELIREALTRALDVPLRDVRRSRAAIFASLVLPHMRARRAHRI